MHRISLKALRELGCVTFIDVREHERQARETEQILDRVCEIAERTSEKLEVCPATLRAT